MDGKLWFAAVILAGGCASQPASNAPTAAAGVELSCAAARENVAHLQRQLNSRSSTGEPAALSAPSLARQNDMLRSMRAAAAQEQARQSLATQLQYLQERCL